MTKRRVFTLAISRVPTEAELRGIDRAVVQSAGLAWASLSDGRSLTHVLAESADEARRVVESLGLGLRVLDDGALDPEVGAVGVAVRDLEQAFSRMVGVLEEARAGGHGDEALSAVVGADGGPVVLARDHLATLTEAAESVLPGGPEHPAVTAATQALHAVGHTDRDTAEDDAAPR